MATTTTLANDIGVIVSSDLVQGFFRNDEFFSLFPQTQADPDTSHRWPLLTAAAISGEQPSFSLPKTISKRSGMDAISSTLFSASIAVTSRVSLLALQ